MSQFITNSISHFLSKQENRKINGGINGTNAAKEVLFIGCKGLLLFSLSLHFLHNVFFFLVNYVYFINITKNLVDFDIYEMKCRATGEKDVRFKVLYCGICRSDLHYIKNDWKTSSYPVVPGHEIVV